MKQIVFFFIWFSFFWLAWSSGSNAQTTSNPCNEWQIVVSATPLNAGGSGVPACLADPSCGKLLFYVYLEDASNGEPGSNSIGKWFRYTEFYVSGYLSVQKDPGATHSTLNRLSVFNPEMSYDCSPPPFNVPGDVCSPLFSVEDGAFAWQNTLEPSEGCNEEEWFVNGRRLLFVLAVDAFPNEIVNVFGVLAGATLVTPGGLSSCVFNLIATPLGGESVADPSNSCLGGGTFRLGAAQSVPIPGYPNRMQIPVFIGTGTLGADYDEFDIMFRLNLSGPPSLITLAPGLLITSGADAEVKLYNEPFTPNQRRVYAKRANPLSIPANLNGPVPQNTLFYIITDGPRYQSQCFEFEADFTAHARGKLSDNTVCCKLQVGTKPSEIEFGDPSKCPTFNSGRFLSITPESLGMDCDKDLLLKFYLNGDLTGISDNVSLIANITLSPGAVIDPGCSSAANCIDPGFPCILLTPTGANVVQVKFTTNGQFSLMDKPELLFTLCIKGGCVDQIEFVDALLAFGNSCENFETPQGDLSYCPSDYLVIDHNAWWNLNQGIEDVMVNFDCGLNFTTICEGTVSVCGGCINQSSQTITPMRDDNWLNGVTTFDLVLINRHILGQNLITSPYALIAADANKSGTITAFDIGEIRKLILGIYQNGIPPKESADTHKSWRFVDAAHVFGNPANPWDSDHPPFPESITIPAPAFGGMHDFIGIKIGDVDGSAIANSGGCLQAPYSDDRSNLPVLALGSSLKPRKGQAVRIPVFWDAATPLTAFQMALAWDADRFRMDRVILPEGMDEYLQFDYHIAADGECRMLLYHALGQPLPFESGVPCLYIEGEWLRDAAAFDMSLAAGFLHEAYLPDGTGYRPSIALRPYSVAEREKRRVPDIQMQVYPNPAEGPWRFTVYSSDACEGVLSVRNYLGQEVVRLPVSLTVGENTWTAGKFPRLDAGAYTFSLQAEDRTHTLKFIRH